MLLLIPGLASAQATIQTQWDIAPVIADLARQTTEIGKALNEMKPDEWVTRGAPDAYVGQWQTARTEAGYLNDSALRLQKQPERVSIALDTLFRFNAIDTRVKTLAEGARAYDSPAAGDHLVALLGEAYAHRDRLQQYALDLSEQREQEFSIVDREAQRCRVQLNAMPVVRPNPAKPKPVQR